MFFGRLGHILALLSAVSVSLAANAESKRYLVKFKSAETFATVTHSISSHSQMAPGVMAPMRLMNSNAVVAQTLDNVQLLVIESDDAKAVQSLRSHPAIQIVEEEIFHPAPKPIATWGGGKVPSSVGVRAIGAFVPRPWGIDAVRAPQAWSVTRGNTSRLVVLDTGVDKDHPAIAPNFEQGKNFTGGDPNDFKDTIGHGTHVSGTILGAGLNGGLIGVAPEARLLMGKVCSDRGCSSVAIANGLNWAISQHVDVVSMSLGGPFLSDGEAQAILAVENAGIMVVAASGNDGTNQVSYPAAMSTVLAVGAVDSSMQKAEFSNWGPELGIVAPGVDVYSSVPRGTGRGASVTLGFDQAQTVKALPFQGSSLRSLDHVKIAYVKLGKPEDFASADVSGKIALVSRGENSFKDKVTNAIQKGALGVIIMNNAPGLIQGSLTADGREVGVPVAMIEQSVGEQIKTNLVNKGAVTISFAVEASDYAAFQGTSMATPHVSGVALLVRSVNRSLTPAQVRDVLKSTATVLGPNDENQYGSGMVNAEAAVARARSTISVALNQTAI